MSDLEDITEEEVELECGFCGTVIPLVLIRAPADRKSADLFTPKESGAYFCLAPDENGKTGLTGVCSKGCAAACWARAASFQAKLQ